MTGGQRYPRSGIHKLACRGARTAGAQGVVVPQTRPARERGFGMRESLFSRVSRKPMKKFEYVFRRRACQC